MIDFGNIPNTGGNFESLEEGWYTIKVETAELTNSKNGPDTMIKVKFGVVSPAKHAKRKVWNNFNLGSKSLWVLKNFLDSSGKNTDTMGMEDENKIAADMVGLVTEAYLEPSTTQAGKPSNNIKNFRKIINGTDSGKSTPSGNNMFE